MTRVVIIDTETTGFEQPVRPVEVAFARMSPPTGGTADTLNPGKWDYSLVEQYRLNPGKPIEYGAVATHFIRDEDVADATAWDSFAPPAADYYVGHNIDYDWEVLGKPEVKRICTLALAREVFPDVSHKLTALYFMLRAEVEGCISDAALAEVKKSAHSAVGDILFCGILLRACIDKLCPSSWEDLWRMSEEARIPKKMPFGKHNGGLIAELPQSYCKWLLGLSDLDPYLRTAVLRVAQ